MVGEVLKPHLMSFPVLSLLGGSSGSCFGRISTYARIRHLKHAIVMDSTIASPRNDKNTGKDNRSGFNTLIHIIYNFSKEKGKLLSLFCVGLMNGLMFSLALFSCLGEAVDSKLCDLVNKH